MAGSSRLERARAEGVDITAEAYERLHPDGADLVLFDPDRVIDGASLEDSPALSDGINGVWVNGSQVYREGVSTGDRSGQLVTRSTSEGNKR